MENSGQMKPKFILCSCKENFTKRRRRELFPAIVTMELAYCLYHSSFIIAHVNMITKS